MTALHAALAFVLLQRSAELMFAAANTRRLRSLGAVEIDARGYPWIVAPHAAWLAGLLLFVPPDTAPSWPLLGLYAALQLGRVWVIASLGRRWTTRIIVLPGAPLVHSGPYRWLRHPNYLIVAAEIALLPLAFGAVPIAVLFTAANIALILRRIRIEDAALALPSDPLPTAAEAGQAYSRPQT